METRIRYTDAALPFIMEALGYEKDGEYITKGGEFIFRFGKKVKLSDVIGFDKDIGPVVHIFDLVAAGKI